MTKIVVHKPEADEEKEIRIALEQCHEYVRVNIVNRDGVFLKTLLSISPSGLTRHQNATVRGMEFQKDGRILLTNE